MGAAEAAAALDAWPRVRQPRFALRRGRLQPGPLKPLDRRGRRPVRSIAAGLLGLSLVATWAVASQIRSGGSVPEQSALGAVAGPVQEAARPIRAAAPVQAAPAREPPTALEPPLAAMPAPEPQPTVSVADAPVIPASKPVPARAMDLGALPVLTLDESAFDAIPAPLPEPPPQAAARARVRP